MKNSFLFRLFFKALLGKFKPNKNWLFDKDLTVIKFSAACTLMTSIYRIVRHQFAKKNGDDRKTSEIEYVLSCGLSALGLLVMTSADRRIFKLLLYSTAVKAFVRMIGNETGLFEPIKEGRGEEKRFLTVEGVISYVSIVFLCYCYIYEVLSLSPANLKLSTPLVFLNSN